MNNVLKLTWPNLGTIRVQLLQDRAPGFCGELIARLPLTSITWHSVISGENVGFPLPVVWTEFENPAEREPGKAFLYPNGQLGIIPYGVTTEPGLVNVFGEVFADDMETLKSIGSSVGAAFRTRQTAPMFVHIELVSDDAVQVKHFLATAQ